jgi:hypothetical protein
MGGLFTSNNCRKAFSVGILYMLVFVLSLLTVILIDFVFTQLAF